MIKIINIFQIFLYYFSKVVKKEPNFPLLLFQKLYRKNQIFLYYFSKVVKEKSNFPLLLFKSSKGKTKFSFTTFQK